MAVDIAIVGTSVLYPGSSDSRGFWRDIITGKDLIQEVPSSHWLSADYYDSNPSAPDKTYARRGSFLSPIPFDPMEFGIPPANLTATDTSQLLALVVAKRLLDQVQRSSNVRINRDRVSVLLGVASTMELVLELNARIQRPVIKRVLQASGIPSAAADELADRVASCYVPWQEASFPGLLGNVVAGRIANRFDLAGTNSVVDAACASSLAAIHMAILELQAHRADIVLTGGVDTLNDIFMYLCFSQTHALSLSGDCRPFSSAADGTILGEGIGFFALKRLDDAQRDGNEIWAVIRGIGTSSDGSGTAIYAPKSEGQEKALRRAYADAGIAPKTVDLVEAHGTGTAAGDVAEFAALSRVFGQDWKEGGHPWCALGSVKSQIGHTKAAAGAAGLFKAVMALHHRVLPPTIKIDTPNPRLDLDHSPFYLNTAVRPWVRHGDEPRRAAVSAFGFGGSNFHLVVEEYTGPESSRPPKLRTLASEWIPFGADNLAALTTSIAHLHESLAKWSSLARIAYERQRRFDACKAVRLSVVSASVESLRQTLEDVLKRLSAGTDVNDIRWPAGVYFGQGEPPGKLAMLFPGQGSQYLNMGRDMTVAFEEMRGVLDRVAEMRCDGYSPDEIIYPRSVWTAADRQQAEVRLTDTRRAQLAIGVVSAGYVLMLQRLGVQPAAVAGHSFGELTALWSAGAWDEMTLFQLAQTRGRLMAEAAQSDHGTMTAVSTSEQRLRDLLRDADIGVNIAGYNSPNQLVLAGPVTEIEKAETLLSNEKMPFRRLDVSAAFHSDQVAPAVNPFRLELDSRPMTSPRIPVYSNVTGTAHQPDPETIKNLLARQIAEPVKFSQMIQSMYADGVRVFLEVGPGRTLTGLAERSLDDPRVRYLAVDQPGRDGVTAWWQAVAQLAALGIPVDAMALWEDYEIPEDEAESSHSPATVAIGGSNYGKLYPGIIESFTPLAAFAPREEIRGDNPSVAIGIPASSANGIDSHEDLSPPWAAEDDGWTQAVQDQVTAAHIAFQKSLSEGHQAFLKLAESAILARRQGQRASAIPNGTALAPRLDRIETPIPKPTYDLGEPPPDVMASAARPIPSSDASPDFLSEVFAMVAEKTGYPADMLQPDHALEQDLGIDSIKRVEIFSALKERYPGLDVAEVQSLGALKTLGDVAQYLSQQTGEHSPVAPELSGVRAPISNDASRVWAEVQAVVAEKTGYPADMLQPDHALEQDLGIDSIKRVEILSALKDRYPSLDVSNVSGLENLRTLDDIRQALLGEKGGVATPKAVDRSHTATASEPVEPTALLLWNEQFEPRMRTGLSMIGCGEAGPIYVVGGPTAIATRVQARLEAMGANVVRSSKKVSAQARALIYLGGLQKFRRVEEAIQVNYDAFNVVRQMAPQLADGGLFVTVQATGGDFGASSPDDLSVWSSGLRALVKTVGKEYPKVQAKAIDLGHGLSAQQIADFIVDEVQGGAFDMEVGLKGDGTRWVPVLRRAAFEGPNVELAAHSVIVATGGGRGITADLLIALAQIRPFRMALLGRTSLGEVNAPKFRDLKEAIAWLSQGAERQGLSPADMARRAQKALDAQHIRETLEKIRALGSEVDYWVCDVQDAEAVQEALHAIRQRFGPINAVVHGAGIIRDRRIADKTDDEFRPVFDTKVRGLYALLDQLEAEELTHVAVLSSVSAKMGNVGQVDYAMANEVMSAVVRREHIRRGSALVARSWAFGPWDGGMVDDALRQHFLNQGVGLIPRDLGVRYACQSLQRRSEASEWLVLAAPPADASPRQPVVSQRQADWRISAEHYPYLAGHTIQGSVVVPFTVVIDMMMRAAQACFPALAVVRVEEVNVLHGIRLQRFFDGGDVIHVTARFDGALGQVAHPEQSVDVELTDDQGVYLYKGRVVLAQSSLPSDASSDGVDILSGSWPCSIQTIYDTKLFHADEFQVISGLNHFSQHGASAELQVTVRHEGLIGDPLLLDGGLQILGVWGLEFLRKRSLPTAVRRLVISRPLTENSPVRCAVRVHQADPLKIVADLDWFGSDGRHWLSMESLEVHCIGQETSGWRVIEEVTR
ncbi:MAG: 3-oxoacyl-ACP reductase [Sulfobacillus acidophilus]|uniref:3-oxoacyl-ACP reductase n=1 Tax=Sulfobacillus acidophilus TaxID=53633 RepID=A0A2T2WG16_9FIRM|nr:MAG: 3-oxoacyl-ACP reductase [Sulfobacillus acidophilus]